MAEVVTPGEERELREAIAVAIARQKQPCGEPCHAQLPAPSCRIMRNEAFHRAARIALGLHREAS